MNRCPICGEHRIAMVCAKDGSLACASCVFRAEYIIIDGDVCARDAPSEKVAQAIMREGLRKVIEAAFAQARPAQTTPRRRRGRATPPC